MLEVTDATFEEKVLRADLPTLVDFWAEWCMPCRMVAPVVEEIAREYDGRLQVVKMDVGSNPDIPARLGITHIPTLILFNGGREIERFVGYRPKQALEEALLPHLS